MRARLPGRAGLTRHAPEGLFFRGIWCCPGEVKETMIS